MQKFCSNCANFYYDGLSVARCRKNKLLGIYNCSDYVEYDNICTNTMCENIFIKNEEKTADMVNHPNHYNRNGLECMTVIRAALGDEKYEGFLTGNIIKYIFRYPDKNGIEDCKKARFYLNELIELLDK